MPLDGRTSSALFIEYVILIILLQLIENFSRILKGRKLGPREQVVNVLNIFEWFCVFRWNTRPGDNALHESCRHNNKLIWTKRHDDTWTTNAEKISPKLNLCEQIIIEHT